MIELVVLDVNETLFPLDPVASRMTEVGLDGRFELWFTRILRDGIAVAAAGRIVTFRDLAEHHLRAAFAADGRAAPPGAAEHVLGGFEQVEPHPDVAPGLQALRERGVPAVALTNGSADLTRAFLARSGLIGSVAAVHDVSEVGRWKPAPDPYAWLIRQRGVPADRTAMIAVHPWDVFGAQSAGLVGAWLDRDGALYPEPFGSPDVQAPDLPALVDALFAPLRHDV